MIDHDELDLTRNEHVTVWIGPTAQILCTAQEKGACRSCGADVWWVFTPRGKWMPVDVVRTPEGKVVSHFVTCPQSKTWRKPHAKRA